MAHFARGPSTEELSGAWDALDQYDTAKIQTHLSGPCATLSVRIGFLENHQLLDPGGLDCVRLRPGRRKEGARLVTGVSGASDILEILASISMHTRTGERCLEQYGICYLPGRPFSSPVGEAHHVHAFHFRFYIIGPLTRPCEQTSRIVIGAYAPGVCDQLIAVLKEIAMPAALAPYGMAHEFDRSLGMDEFSLCGPTRVVELRGSRIETYEVSPRTLV